MRERKTDIVLTGIFSFIICSCVFLIIKDIHNYRAAQEEYSGLMEDCILTDDSRGQPEIKDNVSEPPQQEADRAGFDRLYEINRDLVCILSIPSLDLTYPVVRGTDNEKYLEYTFEGKKNPAGCLFIDYEDERPFTENNTFIYGHNMKDGSMFGCLKKITEDGFDKTGVNAHIITKDKTYDYRLEKAEVVDINEYKAPEDKKGRLILYTCWRKDKNRRLLVTFSREDMVKSTL